MTGADRPPDPAAPGTPRRPRAVLVGPPGAGKSTVGVLLAERLGVTFRDTDADVEAVAGCTITDLFVERGEPAFRELERAAVVSALTGHDGVLSLGGGAVMDPLTELDLRDHAVVFLDVTLADAARRVGLNRDRPLLVGNPRARWKQLMDARRPVYERVATLVVSTDERSPEEVVEAVVEGLGLARAAATDAGSPEGGHADAGHAMAEHPGVERTGAERTEVGPTEPGPEEAPGE